MSAAVAKPLMTIADWVAMPEDDPGELVDGVLVEEEGPDFAHELVVSWLIHVLRGWLETGRGFVVGSEAKYALSERRGRKPDVAVYLPGGATPARRGPITTPPDIMVEVLSPRPRDGRRDRIEKFDEYAAFGVRWYFIVDPEARTFEVFERGADGRYVRAAGASEGVLSIIGIDDLSLNLDELWSELDRLGEE